MHNFKFITIFALALKQIEDQYIVIEIVFHYVVQMKYVA